MTAWQRFRAWRRSRPFWGGVLTVLAGLELIGSMNLDLAGGHISIGQEGFAAYLVAFTLIIAGPLAWAMPAQRHFYGLIACFVAIYSLIGVNLGGFIAGMLLGITGGGLIFAWTPAPPAAVEDEDGDEQDEHDEPGDMSARHAAIVLLVMALSLSLAGVASVPGSASAAPCAAASASPAPTPSPSTPDNGGIIGGIFDWFWWLLHGGKPSPSPTPTPSPTAKPSPCPSASGSPRPGPSGSALPSGLPTPSGSAKATPSGSANPGTAPGSAPDVQVLAAGQKRVGSKPSRMTGTQVTMINLNFDGVVDLPTAEGTIRVLQFSMSQSDTDNFLLHVYGKFGQDTELKSSRLTVKGGTVRFYTNRFQGNLFGLIPVVFTPTSLPPPIPLPLVFFTNPDIQLVFVQAPILQAPKLRINQVKA